MSSSSGRDDGFELVKPPDGFEEEGFEVAVEEDWFVADEVKEEEFKFEEEGLEPDS